MDQVYRKNVEIDTGEHKGKQGTVVGFSEDGMLLVRLNMSDKIWVNVSDVVFSN